MLEWIDPVTEERHTCSEKFVDALNTHLRPGAARALLASDILNLMGEQNDARGSNARHVRAASDYLRTHEGIFAISLRSTKGGYFIAETDEELFSFTGIQIKLAESMAERAYSLESLWTAKKQMAARSWENSQNTQRSLQLVEQERDKVW